MGCDYVAGLWYNELFSQLAWYYGVIRYENDGRKDAIGDGMTFLRQGFHYTKEWRVSSWSWASYQGEITFLKLDFPEEEHLQDDRALAEILKITIVPENGSDKFGPLASTSITLQGGPFDVISLPPSKYDGGFTPVIDRRRDQNITSTSMMMMMMH
ncbi:hypothetical protein EJ05DRAFT_505420 [Pseudovirgaria hyperparasitica]|uniref:Uncharacterized protein n=1 Tax=Pseudovirgaria hyperparasitica TaxID=470096 RepID=A0A6A6VTC5_9PEZI|nr:uncharacterized protein EJ05DRAFT_505420 [Pseudovirgaria hyperparasitica]KAF2753004.1 hypothetical protein EJ05DRAFT_505420 [Pseudovirgaria hyperparasitica]